MIASPRVSGNGWKIQTNKAEFSYFRISYERWQEKMLCKHVG
jgi:hypothetical protein